MKKKIVWLIRPTETHGIKFVIEFQKKLNCELIVCNEQFKENLKLDTKKIVINEKIMRCMENIKNNTYSNHFYDNSEFSKYLMMAKENLDVFDNENNKIENFEKEKILDFYINFWSEKIFEKKPDFIIFFDIPHCVHDVILLGISKCLKIKSIIIKNKIKYSMLLDENLMPLEHQDSICIETFCEKYLSKKNKNKDFRNVNRSDNFLILLFYSFFNLFKSLIALIFFRKLLDINFKILKLKLNNFSFYPKYKVLFFYSVYYFKSYIFKIYTEMFGLNFKSFKNHNIVFWPLPYAYESTIIPASSPYDIRMLLRKISKKLSNKTLLIKDHPRQFSKPRDQKFARSFEFYNYFKKHKNVHLIKTSYSPDEIIDYSEYIFCSSLSSTFFDAIMKNKKIIFFGPNFYCNEKVRHIDNFDLQKKNNKKIINLENCYINKNNEYDMKKEDLDSIINKIYDILKIN